MNPGRPSKPIQLMLVHEPRPPCMVDLFGRYFAEHHRFWRLAGRMVGAQVMICSRSETVSATRMVSPIAKPIVWFDSPPLPPKDHRQLAEALWGEGVSALPSPEATLDLWDLSRWYPKLQAAFVRQPPTATVKAHGLDFTDPATVPVLERTLRAMERLGDVRKGHGAREVLRPWVGWSPFFDLDGMAPWEGAAAAMLSRLLPFLVQQQENWDLDVGGIALQFLPPHPPNVPVIRVYVIGGAPVWWSARSLHLRGERLAQFRLWDDQIGDEPAHALADLSQLITKTLAATEFVFETVSLPQPHVIDVRPLHAVFEPNSGAHLATQILLAAYLCGLAVGESKAGALAQLPTYEGIAAALVNAGCQLAGHGPFHLGQAAKFLRPPHSAARGVPLTPIPATS